MTTTTMSAMGRARRVAVRFGSLFFLVALWVILGIASPNFRTAGNFFNVALQTSVLAIVAMGMTYAMLTGGIDLSVGSVIALSSAFSAGLAAQAATLTPGTYAGQGLPPQVAIIGGILVGGLIGLINGLLIVLGRIPPFVATLATLAIARGLTLLYTGGYVIPAITPALVYLGSGMVGPVPVPVIVMVILFFLMLWILNDTRFGMHVFAVGGNPETTRLAGVNVALITVAVYVISGMMAGIGGALTMGRLNSAQPQVAVGFELDAIAAPVLGGVSLFGGVGSMQGALIGAFIIGSLNNGMGLLGTDPYLQQVIKGVVFVAAVAWDFYIRRK